MPESRAQQRKAARRKAHAERKDNRRPADAPLASELRKAEKAKRREERRRRRQEGTTRG